MDIAYAASRKSFIHYELYNIKESGAYEINFINLQAFFINRGYFLYRTSATRHIYIRIIDNIVREVGKKDLVDELMHYVSEECSRPVHEYFLKSIGRALNEDFLQSLPSKQVEFKKDIKGAIQLYYRNGIVKITSSKISTFKYSQLPKGLYIWESQIIQRDFKLGIEAGSDFRTFCWNIAAQDKNRFGSICSVIGYLIHNYKNPSNCPAIILNDEVISDNPEGGTGKSLLIKSIENFVRIVAIEGKTFSFDKNFAYQRIDPETKIICFQDVTKNFDFERLFSVITDGMDVEKKGRDSVFISFQDAPKIVITTNYAVKGVGNSHERRRFELEISQHYNKWNTPEKEFGRMLFYDWGALDWSQFDAFIASCCQYYLKNGLMEQTLINLNEKRVLAETNQDFIDFMKDFDFKTIPKSDLYTSFLHEHEEYSREKWFNKKLFNKWVSAFASYKKYAVEDYNNGLQRFFKFTRLTDNS